LIDANSGPRCEWRYAERNACRLVPQPRATQRYQARVDHQERRIHKRLHELAKKHPGSGYRRMTKLLHREEMRARVHRASGAAMAGCAERWAVVYCPGESMGKRL